MFTYIRKRTHITQGASKSRSSEETKPLPTVCMKTWQRNFCASQRSQHLCKPECEPWTNPGFTWNTVWGTKMVSVSRVCCEIQLKKGSVNFGFDTQLWSSFYPPNHVRTSTLEACPIMIDAPALRDTFKVYNDQSWKENIGGNFSATKQENMSWKSQQQKHRRTAPNPWQCADGMEIDGDCDECHLKCKMLCWKYLKIVNFPPCSRSCCDDGCWCFRCTWLRLRLFQWDWLSNALRSAWRHIPIFGSKSASKEWK